MRGSTTFLEDVEIAMIDSLALQPALGWLVPSSLLAWKMAFKKMHEQVEEDVDELDASAARRASFSHETVAGAGAAGGEEASSSSRMSRRLS